jgi:periplasmic divalent cation tolerance protein
MKSSSAHLLVLSTCPDHDAALMLANTLIDEALAACINILPGLTSIYHWQGERKTGTEALLLIKTTGENYPALEARIVALHPYELPEIIAVSMEAGLPGYLSWIDQSCQRSMELNEND